MLLTLTYLLWSLFRGKRAPANPWQSRGFEWRTPSPPPEHNFITPFDPTYGPYAYDEPADPQEPV